MIAGPVPGVQKPATVRLGQLLINECWNMDLLHGSNDDARHPDKNIEHTDILDADRAGVERQESRDSRHGETQQAEGPRE